MEATAELIAEDIDSGKYFVEARHWYNRVYLQPLSETSIVLSTAVIFLCIILTIACNLYSVFPAVETVDTVITLPSTLRTYPVLKKIAQTGKTTREVVSEYLCNKYVQSRESYDYKNLIYSYNFIFRSSVTELFDAYYQTLAISNPNSPVVLYKDIQTVTVNITDTQMQLENNSAVVNFTTATTDPQGKIISSTDWVANISYYLDNYDFSKSIDSKLNFIVTKYDLKQVVTQKTE